MWSPECENRENELKVTSVLLLIVSDGEKFRGNRDTNGCESGVRRQLLVSSLCAVHTAPYHTWSNGANIHKICISKARAQQLLVALKAIRIYQCSHRPSEVN